MAVRVIPRAGRTEVAGERGGSLLVRVAAPPVEGAANAALVHLLAEHLGVARRALTVLRGGSARDKVIGVAGLGVEEARRRLDSIRRAPEANRDR